MNAETKSAEYPARLQVDYPEKLDRMTTFFRLLWIIPIAIILGLLSGAGQTRPGGQGQVQDAPQDPVARMTVNFHHVFPGIGVGRPHDADQDLVNDLTCGVDDPAQIEPVGLPGRMGVMGAEETADNGLGRRAAQPDDTDPRLADGGGDSRNGIGRFMEGHAGPAASS